MTRLIDVVKNNLPSLIRSASDGNKFSSIIYPELINSAEIVVADNVGSYFYSRSENYRFSSFPNVAPPFVSFFIETRVPSSRKHLFDMMDTVGCYFWTIDLNECSEEEKKRLGDIDAYARLMSFDVRWLLFCMPVGAKRGSLFTPYMRWAFGVKPDGTICDNEQEIVSIWVDESNLIDGDEWETMYWFTNREIVWPCLLALSFMHCKNVVMQRETPPAPLSKKHEKKHGCPLVSYHTLNIEPMKKVLHTEGNAEKTGLKQALHICRGHFKDFSKGGGLFGKYKGLYWWDSQVRGSVQQGIADKDYAVKSPKEPSL